VTYILQMFIKVQLAGFAAKEWK